MDETFSVHSFLRYSVAYGFLLILFVLNLISFSIPLTELLRPYFILMAIYYWAIYRPDFIPPLVLFVLGVLYDLVLGFPIALHAILFLTVQWIIKNQRLFFLGQSYVSIWLGFILTCFSVLTLEFIFFSFLAHSFLDIKMIIGNLFVTVLGFPLITLFFILINRLLPLVPKSINSVD